MDFLNIEGNGNYNANGDNLVINLSGVSEDTGFECMPKGDYDCVIDDCTFDYSKSSGAPMLTWKFEVVATGYERRKLFFHTVLNNPIGLSNLKKLLVATQVAVDFDKFNPQAFADEGAAIGLPIIATVGIQNYKGEKRNNVKTIKPAETDPIF